MTAAEIAAKHNAALRDEPGVGHNSAPTRFAKDRLKSYVERIQKLEEEKKGIADDIKDVFTEAKGEGYDTAALRTILREQKVDPAKRQEREAILDTYRLALGMLDA